MSFLGNVHLVIEMVRYNDDLEVKVMDVVSDAKPALGGYETSLGAINREYRYSARTNKQVPMPVR